MFRRIPLDHACPDLVPNRLLRVTELVLEELGTEEAFVRAQYTISPPLPPRGRGAGVTAWPVMWTWAATDDVGTAYEEYGGGHGPRGDHTDGHLALRPAPPPQARRLTLFLPGTRMHG